ncbi:hypothetical protein B0T09DRAFT_393396 [Sordaria sp. MPI-SDFR-AT-0083]|nr:hypothetical protein B0T09DRAFT_393396 [Sordaria sp. MPI-SDFR-AT-0083]
MMPPFMFVLRPLLLLSLGLIVHTTSAAVQLLNFTATDLPGLTSTCRSVINQAINCDPVFQDVARIGLDVIKFWNDDTLDKLCTSTCDAALSTWMRRVQGACANQYFAVGEGFGQSPAAYVEQYYEIYRATCVKDASGKLCNAVFRDAANIDPLNQVVTATPKTSFECNSCFLTMLATRLQMPLASNPAWESAFTYLTSSCGIPSMTLTPPVPSTWIVPITTTGTATSTASAEPTETCSGTKYILKAGDTCLSVSTSHGMSTVNLAVANHLSAFCYDFPTEGTLCIPTDRQCTPYIVKEDDTCVSIADSIDISWNRLVSWNPELGINCDNLQDYVGHVICKSNPGGGWVDLNPEPTESASATIHQKLDPVRHRGFTCRDRHSHHDQQLDHGSA